MFVSSSALIILNVVYRGKNISVAMYDIHSISLAFRSREKHTQTNFLFAHALATASSDYTKIHNKFQQKPVHRNS